MVKGSKCDQVMSRFDMFSDLTLWEPINNGVKKKVQKKKSKIALRLFLDFFCSKKSFRLSDFWSKKWLPCAFCTENVRLSQNAKKGGSLMHFWEHRFFKKKKSRPALALFGATLSMSRILTSTFFHCLKIAFGSRIFSEKRLRLSDFDMFSINRRSGELIWVTVCLNDIDVTNLACKLEFYFSVSTRARPHPINNGVRRTSKMTFDLLLKKMISWFLGGVPALEVWAQSVRFSHFWPVGSGSRSFTPSASGYRILPSWCQALEFCSSSVEIASGSRHFQSQRSAFAFCCLARSMEFGFRLFEIFVSGFRLLPCFFFLMFCGLPAATSARTQLELEMNTF